MQLIIRGEAICLIDFANGLWSRVSALNPSLHAGFHAVSGGLSLHCAFPCSSLSAILGEQQAFGFTVGVQSINFETYRRNFKCSKSKHLGRFGGEVLTRIGCALQEFFNWGQRWGKFINRALHCFSSIMSRAKWVHTTRALGSLVVNDEIKHSNRVLLLFLFVIRVVIWWRPLCLSVYTVSNWAEIPTA